MGIGKFFRSAGNAIAHPKQSVERIARRKMVAMAVATLLTLAAAAGYQTSPAFQEALTEAVNAVWTVIEEAPQEQVPADTQPVESAPEPDQQ